MLFTLLTTTLMVSSGAPPQPDTQAMEEAMRQEPEDERAFASSAAYAHFLRAELAHADGDHRGAEEELELALASEPGHPYLLTQLAEEQARLGDLKRAQVSLEQVVQRFPRYVPALTLMGHILLEEHTLKEAKLYLRRAVDAYSRNSEAYLMLAQVGIEAGNVDEAVRVVNELTRKTGEAVGLKRLGGALAEHGRWTLGTALLKRATKIDPGDSETWIMLAQTRESQGEAAEAEEDYAKALERDPDNQEVMLAAGRSALSAGSPVKAKGYFDRLISVSDDPETPLKVASLYVHQAEVLTASGKSQEAIASMRKVLVLLPENAEAMNFIGYSLAERGEQLEEAEQLLLKAIKIRPERGAFWDSLGWIYYRKGQPERAQELIERAEKLEPDEALIIEHLGDVYQRLSKTEAAKAAYQRALDVLAKLKGSDTLALRDTLVKKLKLLSTGARAQ